jgi:hypothetical protein
VIRAGDDVMKSCDESGEWSEHGRKGCKPRRHASEGCPMSSIGFPW